VRIASFTLVALVACSSLLGGTVAQAETFPSRPLKWIVPFPPGGPTDAFSRPVAQKLSEILGQPVVVENVPGAGASIGMERVARSAPDGYTIGLATTGTHSINPHLYGPRLPHDTSKDFTPITTAARYVNMLVVNGKLPVNTVAKANPGKVSWGSSGVGSATHLAGALLMQRAGIELLHVPYRGATLAMNALLAGDIDSFISDVSIPLEHLRAGTLRGLGVTSAARAPLLADVPAIIEQVPRYTVPFWFALMAPKAMPPEPIARILAELAPLAQPSSELHRRMAERGSQLLLNGPAPLAARLREEIPQWRDVVAAAGIQPE